jgi:hypothetical protein
MTACEVPIHLECAIAPSSAQFTVRSAALSEKFDRANTGRFVAYPFR